MAKHWFFEIIFFENDMGILVSCISLKRTFFKIKRRPCLAGCKNECKSSNHSLNTQIVFHVDKFRVFFFWSRDHGSGMMTSYLGSLVYKSSKLTKIMPNSIKLLNHYSHSNAPQKHVSRPLSFLIFEQRHLTTKLRKKPMTRVKTKFVYSISK